MSTINKSFIIDFDETAIDKHAVPASSVAHYLLFSNRYQNSFLASSL